MCFWRAQAHAGQQRQCFLALAWPQKLWSAQDKGGVTKIVANEYVMVTVKHRLLAVRVFRVSSGYGYA